MIKLSRRRFLEAAGAFAALGPPSPRVVGRQPRQSAPSAPTAPWPGDALQGWFDRPMRWVQLTLVENDPGQFDPKFWLDYFKQIRADAACLSAGGIVAYYPTDIPLHHRSAWLVAWHASMTLEARMSAMDQFCCALV